MKQFLAVEEIYTPMDPSRPDYRFGIKTHEPGLYRFIFSATDWKDAEGKVEVFEEHNSWPITICGELT